MYSHKNKLLLTFSVGIYLIHVYAYGYSGYPNQIFWLYSLAFFFYSSSFLTSKPLLAEAIKLVLVHWLYILAFYIVSFWELIPGTTMRHLPFQSLDWLILVSFFVVGYYSPLKKYIDINIALGYIIIAYTIVQITIFPDLTRFGYGVQSMLLLPLFFAYRKYVIANLLLISMLASNHLTPLVSGVFGVLTFTMIMHKGNFIKLILKNIKLAMPIFISALIFVPILWDQISSTINRISISGVSLSGDDWVREYIILNSIELLKQTTLMGIGYMNFYAFSGHDTEYSFEERTGAIVEGFNLHNSFMTWGLEGGILVILAIILLGYLTIIRIKAIYNLDKCYGAYLFSVLSCFFIFGIAHQLHMAIQFWIYIGFIWGYSYRIRDLAS